MRVKLVLKSGNAPGKEIKLPAPECFIGRGEDCQIRPKLEAISRKHCVIITRENEVVVRDLKSRNGTFVNDVRIEEETVLLSGDVLRVGPLEFEALVEQNPSRPKLAKVTDVKSVVARTAGGPVSSSSTDLNDINAWLDEADAEAKTRRTVDPETRQFRVDDTVSPVAAPAVPVPTPAPVADTAAHGALDETKELPPEPGKKTDKRAPGKLPPRPTMTGNNSREAAADMLKKFFNRK